MTLMTTQALGEAEATSARDIAMFLQELAQVKELTPEFRQLCLRLHSVWTQSQS